MSVIKVSIIIPIYNVATWIAHCLESVNNQTYKCLEVIFVDDCGTDNSISLLKEYLSSHSDFPPYKILSHDHNRGLSAARNTGLAAAQGDYVYFLDSDDEISETCIKHLVAALGKKCYEVVIGSIQEQYGNGETVRHILKEGEVREPLKGYAEGIWYVMAWNKLCNRTFLLNNGLFFKEGMLHEDVDWSFRLACLCKSMYLLDDVTYFYKIRNESIMTGLSIERDVQIYLQAFGEIHRFVMEKQLQGNPYVYQMVEGKKSGIIYSLLQKGEYAIYRKYYPAYRRLSHIQPFLAYKTNVIGLGYLLRDLHYSLPQMLGCAYKCLFYLMFYKLRGKQIKGVVWR